MDDLTEAEARAIKTWSNVGAPGPPPEEKFVPGEHFLNDHLQPMRRPRLLAVELVFEDDEAERIVRGHHAMEMEDKWDVYENLADPGLIHFTRSWTGFEIFRLRLIDGGGAAGGDSEQRVVQLEVETDTERVQWSLDQALGDFFQVLRWVFDVDIERLARRSAIEDFDE